MRVIAGHTGASITLLLLTITSLVGVSMHSPFFGPTSSSSSVPHAMTPFATYDQLHQWILSVGCNGSIAKGLYNPNGSPGPVPATLPGRLTDTTGAVTFSIASGSAASLVPNHSETNLQVAGVDELDMAKNDGTFLYTVTNNTVAIVLAYPTTDAKLLARVTVNGSIQGIFIDGNKLAVVTQRYSYYHPGPLTVVMGVAQPQLFVGGAASYPVYWGGDTTTSLWIFD